MNAAATNPPDVIAPSAARRLLAWAQHAEAGARADAASALARAYLHSDIAPSMRDEIAIVMTALADDPCATVRRALAEALAGAFEAPRHLALALANDRSDVAAPVLARSPLLSDAELARCVLAGDSLARCAIARRPGLGHGPAAALAEAGGREAALALIGNLDANLTPGVLRRLFERFGADAEMREALLARPDLPASLEAEIVTAKAKTLSDFAIASGWLGQERAERIARDGSEAAVAAIAAGCDGEARAELVRALRERGALTMALLLRSLLGGRRELVATALADLTGFPAARALAFLRDPNGQGFAALALKAGLPRHALVAFRAILNAVDVHGPARGGGLRPPLIKAAIAACEARGDRALAPILSFLWRLAAEAARTSAGSMSCDAIDAPSFAPRLDFAPAASKEGAAPPVLAFSDASGAGAPAPLLAAAPADPANDAAPRIELRADLIRALDAA